MLTNCIKNVNRHFNLVTVFLVTMLTGQFSYAQQDVGAVLERGIGFTANLSYPAKTSRGRISAGPGAWFNPDKPASRPLITGELILWPNPSGSETRVTVSNMTDQAVGKGYRMQVHATDGRLVHQQGWSAGQGLDVSGFAEGTYLVTVRRGDLLFTQKLFVKKQ